jgi:hypothetical protein
VISLREVLVHGVMLWADHATQQTCLAPFRGVRGTPESWDLLLAHCHNVGRLHDLGVIFTCSGALLAVLALAGFAMTLEPRHGETRPRTVHPALARNEELIDGPTVGEAPRRGRWIARQTVLVLLALGALAVGAILLINGTALWIDRAGPEACVASSRLGFMVPARQVCHAIGPWRDGAILLTGAGATLAFFGLGVVPASVRTAKRQFWFQAGTWVRGHPAGPLPHC